MPAIWNRAFASSEQISRGGKKFCGFGVKVTKCLRLYSPGKQPSQCIGRPNWRSNYAKACLPCRTERFHAHPCKIFDFVRRCFTIVSASGYWRDPGYLFLG